MQIDQILKSSGDGAASADAELMLEVTLGNDPSASPSRPFQATKSFLEGCTKLGSALLPGAQPSADVAFVLEDVDRNRITTCIRFSVARVSAANEQADDNPDRAGEFLARATSCTVTWLAQEGAQFSDLVVLLEVLATKAGQSWCRPTPAEVRPALEKFGAVRSALSPADKAALLASHGTQEWPLVNSHSAKLQRPVAAKAIQNQPVEAIVRVIAPSYTQGQWRLSHGESTFDCEIEDRLWLQQFHSRRYDVRPGDSLRAAVAMKFSYDSTNELIATAHRIVSVYEVMPQEIVELDPKQLVV